MNWTSSSKRFLTLTIPETFRPKPVTSKVTNEPNDAYSLTKPNVHYDIQPPISPSHIPQDSPKLTPQDFIYTSISPTSSTNPTPPPNTPVQHCECILTLHAKRALESIPDFPQPLLQPSKIAIRISTSRTSGLGMFAARPLRAGDLLFSERPMLVCPQKIPLKLQFSGGGVTDEEVAKVVQYEREMLMEESYRRMSKEARDTYMSLVNSHAHDGSGPIVGRQRTNGYRFKLQCKSPDGPGSTTQTEDYSGVCDMGSRINHSCRPNSTRTFHEPSFSFQFYAVRDIRQGDEITISYVEPFLSTADREAALRPYGFRCTCSSCQNPRRSDERRRSILQYVPEYHTIMWALRNQASGQGGVKTALKRIQAELDLIKAEGLETTSKYGEHLVVMYVVHKWIGKEKRAKSYEEMAQRWAITKGTDLEQELARMSPEGLALPPVSE